MSRPEPPRPEPLRPEPPWPEPPRLDRAAGRRLYGQDPAAYQAGRPDYPERVYEVLATRCGLRSGSRVVEIGPGTGQATARLLAAGATVTGVEPSEPMAGYLRQSQESSAFTIINSSFEDAPLKEDAFDLAVAAYSWHWVDPRAGAAQLRRVLAPGGWAALWWTLFGDQETGEEFNQAVTAILGPTPGHRGPGQTPGQRPPMQIDEDQHRAYLSGGGFTQVSSELIRERVTMTAAQVRALFATMAVVLRRDPDERPALLDAVAAVVRDRFGGSVTRELVTGLYTARLPSGGGPA
jgi:SAM-dependent methyltransferase